MCFIGKDDFEEVECYPSNTQEDLFKSEKYSGYNQNISDNDWDAFY